jgi:hypothetical protein
VRDHGRDLALPRDPRRVRANARAPFVEVHVDAPLAVVERGT